MKIFTKLVGLLLVVLAGFFAPTAKAQSVLDPNDPVITYDPNNPPTQPASGIGKWVRTRRLWWNTDSYKAYFYKTNCFRLKFPKTYNPTAADGKKYPILVFLHGVGEAGTIYDNELSLYLGGDVFGEAVDIGTFDGYVLVMQTQDGFWSPSHFQLIREIIDYMVPNNKVDPFRVVVNGLSGGGAGTWDMLISNPAYVAGAIPMSGTSINYMTTAIADKIKFTPVWNIQGGTDRSPDPYTAHQVRDYFWAAGANLKYTEYPDLGHGTWYRTWSEPDFFPFALRAYSANPWPLNGQSQFCPGVAINTTLGLAPGFDAYEWRKNGVVVPGAVSNTLQVTQPGTYSARIRKGSIWSDTSRIPVVIQFKAPTVPPQISIPALKSNVIPSLDTNGVQLTVPNTYTSYVWQKSGSSTTLSTANTYFATSPGNYVVQVTEPFGCAGVFTNPYTVIDANGPNKPDPATGLSATALSFTSVRLDWTINPNPQFVETNFEIYQARQPGGPYTLIAITNPRVGTYTVNSLSSNVRYYYKIRAVNNTAAAPGSNEASVTTIADTIPPTAPGNLVVTGTSRTSVSLSWNPSTDNVGVKGYNLYINGVFSYSTVDTQYTAYGLTPGQVYNFTARAKDLSDNFSPYSNQVTAQTLAQGWSYKYYTYTGTWDSLQNLSALSPLLRGFTTTLDLNTRTQDFNFAYLWEGFIHITTPGVYYFRTNSDDGSRLWLGSLNQTGSAYNFSAPSLVNNDGIHGLRDATSSAINLAAGMYPIAIAYYQQGGAFGFSASWSTPQTGASNFVPIPLSALLDTPTVGGLIPAAPSNLVATAQSYKKISLSWTRNSNNETGFEIWRGTDTLGISINTVATVAAGTTTYADSNLDAGTKYYYRVRAIGRYGQSAFDNAGPGISYSYYETPGLTALPNFNTLTPVKTGRVTAITTGMENRYFDFQLKFVGPINIPTAGVYTFYTYSDDGSNLYIDGMDSAHLVVKNDFIQAQTERSGTVTLSAGTHTLYVTYFQAGGGYGLTASMQGPGMAKQEIPAALLGQALASATTQAPPPVPAAPTGLIAHGTSTPSTVTISWTNNANNADNYQLYRSTGGNTNYLIRATLPANAVSFKDTGLFANYVYYYKVRAVNVGGNSAFSNEDSAQTGNRPPVLTTITTPLYMHYATQMRVNVQATSPDAQTLTVVVTNLPPFGTYTSTGNGTGTITFNSTQAADQGVYSGITVTVTDQHGGSAKQTLSLTVNSNYPPVITRPVANVTVNEKQIVQFSLYATDQNPGDSLTWSFTGLPSFATPVTGSRTVRITLAPGYADHGTYRVTAKVDDGNHGVDTASFLITVVRVNPNKKVYINFTDGTLGVNPPAPWNATKAYPVQNFNFPGMLDDTGLNSGIGLLFTSNWQSFSNTYGATTGNNSGIYPDVVMQSAYYANAPQTIRIYGLSPASKYNFTFFGSRGGVTDNRNSVYTINGSSVTLNAAGNTQNTVSLNALLPNADSSLTLTLQPAAGASYGYLNAMVIQSVYDDGTVPAKARNMSAQFAGNKVSLTWIAAAYNATGYQVYRATGRPGPYTLLNPGATDPAQQSYNDSNLVGKSTYYYYVTSSNARGTSPSSDTVSVAIPNLPPVISPIADVSMKTQQVVSVNVSATANPTGAIVLKATNLPSFASFTDSGNGNGVIRLAPGNTTGVFAGLTITATDSFGASSSRQFQVTVTVAGISKIYVDFNQTLPASAPWNSFNSAPIAGTTLSNLVNDTGTNTGSSIILVDGFEGANELGAVTGNNSGVFPDVVMQTAYFESTTNPKRVRITGLTSANYTKYNLIFFASRGGVTDDRTTKYSAGGQSVSLNAAGNTTNTVQINGLVPDASGNIEFTATKASTAVFGYINALVIQSYKDSGQTQIPAPGSLQATGKSNTSVTLKWVNTAINQTGVEISRSTVLNGMYTVVTTVGANVTSYTDQGLQTNTGYYYRVRAVVGTSFSPYSNTAYGATFSYQVYIHFNDGTFPAGAPWNNTNRGPAQGDVYANMSEDSGNSTGINMTVMDRNFRGTNPFGMNTGNNSGIYPDNVIRQTWWLDVGNIPMLKIDGLNQSLQYNFVFFASRDLGGVIDDRTTVYSIRGQSASLNAANNISQTAQISNVRPDANGAVFITINAGGGSAYGYIGALVIQAARVDTSSLSPIIIPLSLNSTVKPNRNSPDLSAQDNTTITAYPNPFIDDITVRLSLDKPVDKLTVLVIDLSGRTVFAKELSNLQRGTSEHRLGINGNAMSPGIYLIQVLGSGRLVKTFKLIKSR